MTKKGTDTLREGKIVIEAVNSIVVALDAV